LPLFQRLRLSVAASRASVSSMRCRVPKPGQAYEPEVPVEVRESRLRHCAVWQQLAHGRWSRLSRMVQGPACTVRSFRMPPVACRPRSRCRFLRRHDARGSRRCLSRLPTACRPNGSAHRFA
jgi:hypothetical protein